MPIINGGAQFTPLGPGKGRFTLNSFNAPQHLNDYTNTLEILVSRRNDRPLAEWPVISGDCFYTIKPRNAQMKSVNFEFEVGPDVVNALAYDNSGDYLLKLKDKNRTIISFLVDMKGTPVAAGGSLRGTSQASKVEGSIKTNPNPFEFNSAQPNASAEPKNPFASDANFNASANFASNGASEQATDNKAKAQPNFEQEKAKAASSAGFGRKLSIIIGILCFLALLGIGLFFLKDSLFGSGSVLEPAPTEQTQEQNNEPEQNAQPEEEATNTEDNQVQEDMVPVPPQDQEQQVIATHLSEACTLKGSTLSDTEILKNCLQSQPQAQELNDFLYEALATGHCEIAQRLLTSKGRSQSGSYFAYILSVYSDPAQSKTSKCFKKDAEQAKYWLERAQLDPKFDEQRAKELVDRLPG